MTTEETPLGIFLFSIQIYQISCEWQHGYVCFDVLYLLFAAKGNLPTVYSTPSFLRSSSDLPTHATSGCV
jgi:hypothetical protein